MSEEKKAPETTEETVVVQETQAAPVVEEKVEATEVAAETPVVEEAPKEKKAPAKKAVKAEAEPVQEEFDWDNVQPKGFGDGYSAKQKKS